MKHEVFTITEKAPTSVLNVKALVGGAFSVIVQTLFPALAVTSNTE